MLTDSQEHFWGCELTKDKPTFTWTFEEEDDDDDYLMHTLFLKNAVLGSSAVKGERNLVEIETKNFDKKDVKQALLSLTLGQSDMCNVDVSFGHDTKVIFRLVEGAGPICLGGQQLVEFPPEEMDSQDESALEVTEEDDLSKEESPKSSRKRKAVKGSDKKGKKGKMEESMSSADDSVESDEEDEDDEDDEEDDDDEEDMEEDEEPAKKKKAKKDAKGGKGLKTTKTSPKKAAKKATKKGKK
ncbi:ANO39-like protein [Mya arenaria]|uniref:ANO39-like protein n=1 Tax=Mya arenaria TaxID=6604 RepID=A0ABY7FIR7_MYAAR|nr:nucleoplasmin-like protein ANO39 isoform X2 [Mya arenaria]WAR22075.1 ANO39-like protein [Mya arenaria]